MSAMLSSNPVLHANISAVVTDRFPRHRLGKGLRVAGAGVGGKVVLGLDLFLTRRPMSRPTPPKPRNTTHVFSHQGPVEHQPDEIPLARLLKTESAHSDSPRPTTSWSARFARGSVDVPNFVNKTTWSAPPGDHRRQVRRWTSAVPGSRGFGRSVVTTATTGPGPGGTRIEIPRHRGHHPVLQRLLRCRRGVFELLFGPDWI